MRVNFHCHSACSMDGGASMTEMAFAALAAGVDCLCFTDHCDLLDGQTGAPCVPDFSWAACMREFCAAEAALQGRIELRLGVELGMPQLQPEQAERILAHRPLDFVIGSNHNSRMGPDYYYLCTTDRSTCCRLLEDYLQLVLELAKTPYYDVLGHLTYPLRYMRWRDGVGVDFRQWEDLVRLIFQTVIAQGKGIELNTSGYRSCGGEPMPSIEYLKLYRSLGGEIVTIGSDAHTVAQVADGLERGMALLKEAGFRYVAVYRARQATLIRI